MSALRGKRRVRREDVMHFPAVSAPPFEISSLLDCFLRWPPGPEPEGDLPRGGGCTV